MHPSFPLLHYNLVGPAISLSACYAMPGTDLAYAAPLAPYAPCCCTDMAYGDPLSPYAATQCPY
eukprot:2215960-Rhodomonas_salina.2